MKRFKLKLKKGGMMRSGFANDSMQARGIKNIKSGKRTRGRGLRGGKWWESLLSGAAAVIPALL